MSQDQRFTPTSGTYVESTCRINIFLRYSVGTNSLKKKKKQLHLAGLVLSLICREAEIKAPYTSLVDQSLYVRIHGYLPPCSSSRMLFTKYCKMTHKTRNRLDRLGFVQKKKILIPAAAYLQEPFLPPHLNPLGTLPPGADPGSP